MKKLVYLFAFLMVSGLFFMSSCTDEEEGDLKPTVNFKGGAGYVSEDITLDTEEDFTIGLTAASNSSSGANLSLLELTRVYNNATWFTWDTAINVSYYSIDITLTSLNVEGTEKINIKVTDKDGQSSEISLNITTESSAGPITAYDQKILGSYQSSTGSSFASVDGTIYSLAEAKANQSKVDWLYFYGAADLATLAAPDDAHAALVFNNATNGLQTWTTKNATRLRKVTTAIDWNAITDDSIIMQEAATEPDQTRIATLAVGDVLLFKTVTAKYGMIKVNNIAVGADGTIDISVKVQQ
ncbi:MAG TPA: hypothetical protein PKH94_06340 [Bacteroidales bacterium]|nr:hypothetical protein [Bacteroidales bacterium]HNS46838.1 hypothetical protein [Bacteroidales bacterium]